MHLTQNASTGPHKAENNVVEICHNLNSKLDDTHIIYMLNHVNIRF